MAETVTDLERVVKALQAKRARYSRLWEYYDGLQPLTYSTKRLQEAFSQIDVRFVMNWCAVVVNAVADRMVLKRLTVTGNEEATAALNRLWWETELGLDDDDVQLGALVCGESFVVVWPDEDGVVEAYYHDPRLCHLVYDAEHPRVKRLGAKWWAGEDGKQYLNLYYPERIEYYWTAKATEQVDSAKEFVVRQETAVNPFGVVPVFQMRMERRKIQGELGAGTLSLQDAVNKLLADMMVSAEYGAFKQRYVISSAEVKGKLKNAPNEIWDLPAGDGMGQGTVVGEFEETNLRNYLDAIDQLATAIAVTTRTPKHLFFEKAGSNPSGETLIALEAGLNKKALRYGERFSATWREVAGFAMGLAGWEIDPMAVQVVYEDARTMQPVTQAQARLTNVQAGMALRSVLRQEGVSEEEIGQVERDKAAESEAAAGSLAEAVLRQERAFERQ